MKILVTYGSKMGGTQGIAQVLGDKFAALGFDATVKSTRLVDDVTGYDAVIVGGALYNNRWHKDARRFVKRHAATLSERPVWLFSSGPLDNRALEEEIPPVGHVRKAMEITGAREHMTFGGRLPEDATGFPAASMAKTQAGDWRDRDHVEGWAKRVHDELNA